MSHSSLSAQLASLHSKNGAPSRQHSDAIGRGVHHSSKVGHTVLNKNPKHKPSVLHADSRAAASADVPLTTLRENAIASLRYLCKNCSPLFDFGGENLPWKTLFGAKSSNFEHGLNTKETNAKFDRLIKEALYFLSSAWGDSMYNVSGSSTSYVQLGANKPSSVLHALEYLIQNFYAHVHNAEALLVSFLPHHETFLFDRILQLVDLAQFPQWSFLRPYSAARGVNGVPRTAIAKWAASTKDNGGGTIIVERICEIGKKIAKIHARERKTGFQSDHARRGVSVCISFAAATLAETIHIQQASTGSIDETFLRVMIPVLLNSVEATHNSKKGTHFSLGALCPEWRSFGQIMISLIAESCDLNGDLNHALVDAIVKGCNETVFLYIHDEMTANGEEFSKAKMDLNDFDFENTSSSLQKSLLEVTSDALLSIMTVLQNSAYQQKENTPNDQSMLKIVLQNKQKEETYIGYNIPAAVLLAVTKLPFLSTTIGHLLVDRDIDIRMLLSSILAYTISALRKKRNQRHVDLLFQLTTEKSIFSAFRDDEINLTASATAFMVSTASQIERETHKSTIDSVAKLLQAMKCICSSGTDMGITETLSLLSSLPSNQKQLETTHALLVQSGHLCAAVTNDNEKDTATGKTVLPKFDEGSVASMLPPLMALEHPSSEVRLQAISKLQQSSPNDYDMLDVTNSLFRRHISDDDVNVINSAMEAILLLDSNNQVPRNFYFQTTIKEETLAQIDKLSSMMEKGGDEVNMCLASALAFSALVVRANLQYMSTIDGETEFNLVQRLFSDISNTESSLLKQKVASLLLAIGEDDSLADHINEGLLSICKSDVFCDIIEKCMYHETLDMDTKRLLTLSYLEAWQSTGKAKEQSRELKSFIVKTGLYLSTSFDEDSTKADNRLSLNYEIVRQVLGNAIDSECAEGSAQIVSELAASTTRAVYDKLSVHVIKNILDKRKNDSSFASSFLLLESLLRPSMSSLGVERLLRLFREYSSSLESTETFGITLLAMLSLCGHSELRVRKQGLKMFQEVGKKLPDKESYFKDFRSLCRSSSNETSVLMDGVSGLSNLLVEISKKSKDASDFLLKMCYLMGTKGLIMTESVDDSFGDGFCHAASVLLTSMESAGEQFYPLLKRWEKVGKHIFYDFVKIGKTGSVSFTSSQRRLLDSVIVMLKGVTVNNESLNQGIIITNEVTISGRRSRSYSVAASEAISHMKHYPTEMTTAIVDFLVCAEKNDINKSIIEIFETLSGFVLKRTSWVNGVFTKLDTSVRTEIAVNLLSICCKHSIKSAALAMVDLGLNATEIVNLTKSNKFSSNNPAGLHAITVVTECVRHRSKDLLQDENVNTVVSCLFELLRSLSLIESMKTIDVGEQNDYTRCCIVYALLSLTESAELKKMKVPGLVDHADLLVSLVGDDVESKKIKPFISNRIKTMTLQLLTNLCAISPAEIVGTLVPAMTNSMALASNSSNVDASEKTLMAIVPAYCDHAPLAGLSILDFLKAFIECKSWREDFSWEQKSQLISNIVKSLTSHVEYKGVVFATITAVFLANEASEKSEQKIATASKSFFIDLIETIRVSDQIDFSLQMIDYIKKMLSFFMVDKPEQGDSNERHENFFLVSPSSMRSLIIPESSPDESHDKEKLAMLWFIITLVEVLEKLYLLPSLKRFIRVCDDVQAAICLKVWQELVNLQALMSHYTHQNSKQSTSKFWRSVSESIGNVLSTVQRILPTPHFLASVTLLLEDQTNSLDLKRRAILLLSERSMEVDAHTHEATLFLEMIPNLVKIVKSKSEINKGSKDVDGLHLRQMSFEAIDKLAKSLGLGVVDEKLRRKRSALFLPAFHAVAVFLRNESGNTNRLDTMDCSDENQGSYSIEAQATSSASFCAATLVTLLNVKCVPQLTILVKPIISILKVINERLSGNDSDIGESKQQSYQLITLSILRALVAVAENIPQFLTPFVEILLDPDCLPAIKVSQNTNEEGEAIKSMTERLEEAIATKSPIHQLVPTLHKAIKKSAQNGGGKFEWKVCLSILRILKVSISKSSRNELSPLVGKILNALVQVYGYESEEGRIVLLKEANETLLSLVMKLSESQLRSLYSRLREWRGGFDPSSQNKTLTCRRFAFWSLSAAISEKLKNIFLPCMSIVVSDLIKELNHAAASLTSNSVKGQSNKRQKMRDGDVEIEHLSPLQPLLLCLESALKADAHEGGNWVRSEDGQRYRSILEPLGNLLKATIPSNFYVISDENGTKQFSAYERLIEGRGTEEHGNVSQSLTALAAAAGNEQLWKPLNFMLMEACGDERRSEVRKSGVKSLLSIIQTLGEEYMVLLPECLPVLSELLEDDDETIVALAKECVHHGEELLGESLEDSLR